ncbi:MAG TPA: Gfo/Idh/MocA family oxidoreductase [Cyclobacteriaceae bacterium]|jgi:predicted dehydrogenase|nr:Gfo/Idh/MocA family oxidoreductase [Cyclobacteriaceae bacterium]
MSHYSRREFISKIGLGAAMLSLPLDLMARRFDGKKLGVALVGLGYYSEFLLAPALQQATNCYLAGIVTGTPEKAVRWKKQFNIPDANAYTYQTFDRIADNKDIDIIYVVLPNSMHHEYVIRAAKAGKHVICEKPMAVSSKECQEMIDACKKAKVKLSIGYRLHFEPHTKEVMRIANQKVFGQIKTVETSMGFKIGDPTQWRLKKALAGGGAMMDVGIYAIQGARYSTGSEPISVTAQEYKTDPVKFKEVDETIFWQMEFPTGAVSSSVTTYASSTERLFASAENGWIELRPAFGYGPIKGRTSEGELNFPHVIHQTLQMEDFAACILENRETTVGGEEGLRDMKIIEAIYKSIETGKKVKLT